MVHQLWLTQIFDVVHYISIYTSWFLFLGPSSPEVTNLTVLGSRSIYMSWEPPKQFYRTIDHYYIQIIDTSTNHQQRRALENNEREVCFVLCVHRTCYVYIIPLQGYSCRRGYSRIRSGEEFIKTTTPTHPPMKLGGYVCSSKCL
jgi:hypothetical protein